MKKLLLVDPVYNPGNIPPSVSLGKIEAAFANSGVSMTLADFVVPEKELHSLQDYRDKEATFIEETAHKGAEADVVYISAEHGNELKPYPIYPRILKIAREIKAKNPAAKVIVGGALVNLFLDIYKFGKDAINDGSIDMFVTGQSLRALKPISEALGVPLPSLRASTEWNMWDFSKYPNYASVQLRSGCAYKCDFCFEGKIYDKSNVNESLDSVQATMRSVMKRHGIHRFLLEDSVVMSYPDFSDVAGALADTGATFANYARVSEIHRWPEKLETLKKAGSTCAIVGIETLDDSILQSTNKKTLATQTKGALATARTVGIGVQGCFMLGFPAGGLDDSKRTIDFAAEQDLNCYRWHVFMPDYTRLDASFRSDPAIAAKDVLGVQLDVPDRFLLDAIASGPSIGLLDEHTLIRALAHADPDDQSLRGIGYEGKFNYGELVELMQRNILPIGKPLNEDNMYERLFEPTLPMQGGQKVQLAKSEI